ncbi:MAG: MarR family transcriptional regulator [Bacteroidia bacterium]|nr:MarR family transcriptional regulator [Bacteroidia bacterium]
MPNIEKEIVQKEFKNSHHKVLVNILYTSNWISIKQQTLLKAFGLTPQQYNILRILRGQNMKPCTINLIRERMIEKRSDVSRLVDRMHKNGLLERLTCGKDRRQVDVLISKKGLEFLEKIDPKTDEFNLLTGKLSDLEAQTLSLLLDKIRG